MKLYRLFGLISAVIFAAVGVIFLFFPDAALAFFNAASEPLGFPEAPLTGNGFYLILAAAYMYLVTLLAFLMYLQPEQKLYPFLLANAKIVSSVLSLYLFLFHGHYLICLANFAVDGFIGVAAVCLMKRKIRKV